VVKRALARCLVAKKQPGSGVYSTFPNDVTVQNLLGECKVRSTHPSVNQLLEWLEGVEANAKQHGFAGGFLCYNAKGSQHPLVVLDLDLFLDLLVGK
jgi:hypothetical protein